MRRIVLLALIAACAAVPAHADTHTCGGVSPITASCGFSGTLDQFDALILTHGPLFVGRITATITTSTGTYTGWCDYVVPIVNYDAFCNSTLSGVLLPGQAYNLEAHTAQAVTGVPFAAVGRWSVTLQPA